MRRSIEHRDDAGGASMLALAVVALGATGIVAVGRLAGGAVEAARARSAADAVALGAALGSPPAALAAANGARLVRVTRNGDAVEVVVMVGAARATARAALVWEPVEYRRP